MIISSILVSLAAICNAYMDKLMIQYILLPPLEQDKLNHKWFSFNPRAKWKDGKYGTERATNIILAKIGIKTKWLADNCNDGWHTLKSAMIVLLCTATILFNSYNDILSIGKLIELTILGSIWNISFNITFKKN